MPVNATKTYHKENTASYERCMDALRREILFIQTCSFAKVVHYCFAPINLANVVQILNIYNILKPDATISV